MQNFFGVFLHFYFGIDILHNLHIAPLFVLVCPQEEARNIWPVVYAVAFAFMARCHVHLP